MSRVTNLNRARGTGSVAFLQFTRIHKSKSYCLFCFFEGEDAKYYGFRIKENLSTVDWEGIDCGGKSEVLAVCEFLQKHENPSYREAKTAFFIDRDFDEPLSEEWQEAIYTTPCYSIENFYTTVNCFKGILKHEFKINEFDETDESLFQRSVDYFVNTQQAFHQNILEFNAWFKVIRKSGQKLHAGKFDSLDTLVKIEVNKVEKCYDIDLLYSSTKLTREGEDEADLQQAIQSFSDYRCQFRGKQELGFFVEFLKKLKEDLCQPSPQYFPKTKKISFPIPTSNALSALSQYADTPDCLRTYLRKFGI